MSEREAESEPTFSIFLMDLGLHFELQNREKPKKHDVENEQEFGDGKKAKQKRKKRYFGGAGGRGRGPWLEEFEDSEDEFGQNRTRKS